MKDKKRLLELAELQMFQGLGQHQRAILAILAKHTRGAYSSDIRRTLKVKSNVLTGSYDGLERRGIIRRQGAYPPILMYIEPTQIALKYFRGEW